MFFPSPLLRSLCLAPHTAANAVVDPRVLGKSVAAFAVSAESPRSSRHVLRVSNWLKMVRVHAVSLSAQVIEFAAKGNLSFEEHERYSVKSQKSPVYADTRVTSFIRSAFPEPTARSAIGLLEDLLCGSFHRVFNSTCVEGSQ